MANVPHAFGQPIHTWNLTQYGMQSELFPLPVAPITATACPGIAVKLMPFSVVMAPSPRFESPHFHHFPALLLSPFPQLNDPSTI